MGNKNSKKQNTKGNSKDSTISSNNSNSNPTTPNPPPLQNDKNNKISKPKDDKSVNSNSEVKKEEVQAKPADTIGDLFNRFSKGKDVMEPDDVIEFFDELKLDPEDVSAVVLSYHFKAAQQCYFSREEFVSGFLSLKCNNIAELQSKVPTLKEELENPSLFKDIYEFTYLWSRESPEKKNLDLEIACDMLELLLKNRYLFSDHYISFLKEQTSYKCMTKDQWSNFLEFCKIINSDLSNYDENGSWPVMIDDFVEWYKEKEN